MPLHGIAVNADERVGPLLFGEGPPVLQADIPVVLARHDPRRTRLAQEADELERHCQAGRALLEPVLALRARLPASVTRIDADHLAGQDAAGTLGQQAAITHVQAAAARLA